MNLSVVGKLFGVHLLITKSMTKIRKPIEIAMLIGNPSIMIINVVLSVMFISPCCAFLYIDY